MMDSHFKCLSFLLFVFLCVRCIDCKENKHQWISLSDDLPYEYLFSNNLQSRRFSLESKWTELTWYDARRWCRENGGGDLLTIKSNLEAKLLLDKMLNDNPAVSASFY